MDPYDKESWELTGAKMVVVDGEAICSSTYGYWYSRDPDDISTTLSRLVGQVDNMQKVIAGLNRILQEVQDEQKES